MVLPSAVLVESWCLSELSSWVELCLLLTGGHRYPMIEHLGPSSMHWFAATRYEKFCGLNIKAGEYLWNS